MLSASALLLPFLNHDAMTYIFKLNTQRDRDVLGSPQLSALHTTRLASQVCRSWRQLILQSPVIWGNIIDLETLRKARKEWFEEVMKRTGNASLSIYGQINDSSTVNRLISLLELEENWDRVHWLDVVVQYLNEEEFDEFPIDCFYNVFCRRRAPILEEFSFCFDGIPRTNTGKWKDLKLFSGSAPLLRRINSPGLYFDQHTPWISQLVGMTLSGPLKIRDALTVLMNTPLLESLVIESSVRYDDSAKGWTQNIHLPNLDQINIRSNIAGSVLYLSHITFRSNCVLKLTIYDTSTNFQNRENNNSQRLWKIVSAYVEGYFSVRCPPKLAICIGDHGVGFDLYEMWDEANDSGPRYCKQRLQVSIALGAVIRTFDPQVVNMFLSTLASTALDNVYTFEFTLLDSWLPTMDAIIHIIRSLTAVKKMSLTPWAMHGLNNLLDSATLFPNLAEVTIEYQTKVKNLDQILRLFLTRRRKAGMPLRTLHKPDNSRPQGAKHWVFLEQFEGLRVLSTGYGEDNDLDSDDSYGDDDDWDDSEYDGDDEHE